MVKAAALYIVIVISLLIAVISASLLTVAFYYRLEVQKKARMDKLLENVQSGTAIMLSEGFTKYDEELILDLYGDEKDSVILSKTKWGVFDQFALKTFELKDTIKRSFFSGTIFTDQNAIYLADEDRPISVSGKTTITGNGQLPKAGLKQAYVDGTPYLGKEMIYGTISDSGRDLPPLDETAIKKIRLYLDSSGGLDFNIKDSVSNSFQNKELIYHLADLQKIGAVKVSGKIILISDTTININADTRLEDVQVYAPAIVVESGFKGSCQLFATDSIAIGKDCVFEYPSFAGVFKPEDGKMQSKVSLGEGSKFSGILLSYENKRSDLQTMVSLGKNCLVNGEIYATGYIKLERDITIQGKVSAKRFMLQTPQTLYENYLIDLVLNRKILSKYYLSSTIFKREKQEQKILKWLH
ncbi:hypothetical protein [Pedobacter metabolipauper]|uniref:Cytoskeletal protein CcmA (Bactofilin family) n=1 Tax=Pedobacter metabolipauper TaxID=425513 RepID=A0A4R6SZP6_9SPHI|nr:hypothetical protein [Pedobacter metabolipauper]TDQ11567.1 hypothetical protein ATK78_0690 [Pedobacter metabolipauper]